MKSNSQRNVITTLAFSGLLGVAPQAEAQKPGEKPNLVFVFCDQWRRQALGYMGEDPVFTPNLDKFASWSASFDQALSCRPVSGPNRACLMTGKYPINNGVFGNSVPLDPTEDSSLGKSCKAAGYQTAYIGKWHLNGASDPATDPSRRQGFDFWVQSIGHAPFSQKYYIAESNSDVKPYQRGDWAPTYETDVAIDYIEKHKNNPFCVVISYNPPHTSGGLGFENRYLPGKSRNLKDRKYGYGYGGPKNYEKLYEDKDYAQHPIRGNIKTLRHSTDECFDAIPGYFGAITAIDNDFGKLMEYLEKNHLLENTIVIFTADHGESMGSQGLMTKGTWFEESAGVPCIIGWKGKIKNQRRKEVFNSVDVMPTMLGVMGIPTPESADGTDFSPVLFGKDFKAPEYAFLSFDYGGALESPRFWRAVRSERYMYVLCGMNQNRAFTKDGLVLYDLGKDPLQLSPIYKGMGYDKEIDKLHAVLVAQLKKNGDPFIKDYWNSEEKIEYPKVHKFNLSENDIQLIKAKREREKRAEIKANTE
ncbi:MAG: sulfatase [Tannerella sp.]|nr:sulfatase [Tannerella sp.]